MVKAFWKLQEVDAGMNPNHLLTMRLSLPSVTYKDAASVNGFYGGRAAPPNTRARGVGGASTSPLPPPRPLSANHPGVTGCPPLALPPTTNLPYLQLAPWPPL